MMMILLMMLRMMATMIPKRTTSVNGSSWFHTSSSANWSRCAFSEINASLAKPIWSKSWNPVLIASNRSVPWRAYAEDVNINTCPSKRNEIGRRNTSKKSCGNNKSKDTTTRKKTTKKKKKRRLKCCPPWVPNTYTPIVARSHRIIKLHVKLEWIRTRLMRLAFNSRRIEIWSMCQSVPLRQRPSMKNTKDDGPNCYSKLRMGRCR
mmetsp:Transcript_12205/g.19272  ORF Transcript_12205/g.19272 Transcript_12205/m.19272 type:complete len:206 (-) Transcript_12205:128-745(-)